jgi:hypothetical protein
MLPHGTRGHGGREEGVSTQRRRGLHGIASGIAFPGIRPCKPAGPRDRRDGAVDGSTEVRPGMVRVHGGPTSTVARLATYVGEGPLHTGS